MGAQITPKSDFSCLAGLSQQQQVGVSLFSINHIPKQFNGADPYSILFFIEKATNHDIPILKFTINTALLHPWAKFVLGAPHT